MSRPTQVIRRCPVCDSDRSKPRWKKGDLLVVLCEECSMSYASPVPEEFVSGAYYERAGAEYYLSKDKLESDYAEVRFQRELRLFRKHCMSGRVLDVGCSSGAFLFQLRQRFKGCYQVLGTDASGPPLDYAESRGIPVLRSDFLKHAFGSKTFDAITFWAVLEHLVNPKQFLEKALSILKPGGVSLVLVPNTDSLAVRLLQSRYRYIYPQHLNYFTRGTLRKMVPSGFWEIEMSATHFNPIVIWQDWRRKGEDISNAERGALLKRTTAYKQNLLMRPAKGIYAIAEATLKALNMADNLVLVLRKK